MPHMRLFGRKWNFGSDDFVFSTIMFLILIMPIFISLITLEFVENQLIFSNITSVQKLPYAGIILSYSWDVIIRILLIYNSSRGAVMENKKRYLVGPLIYLRLLAWYLELTSIITCFVFYTDSDIYIPETMSVMKVALVIMWIEISDFLFDLYLYFVPKSSPYKKKSAERETNKNFQDLLDAVTTKKSKDRWERRLMLCLCIWKPSTTKKVSLNAISNTLAKVFDSSNLVMSDLVAGFYMLSEEDYNLEDLSHCTIDEDTLDISNCSFVYNAIKTPVHIIRDRSMSDPSYINSLPRLTDLDSSVQSMINNKPTSMTRDVSKMFSSKFVFVPMGTEVSPIELNKNHNSTTDPNAKYRSHKPSRYKYHYFCCYCRSAQKSSKKQKHIPTPKFINKNKTRTKPSTKSKKKYTDGDYGSANNSNKITTTRADWRDLRIVYYMSRMAKAVYGCTLNVLLRDKGHSKLHYCCSVYCRCFRRPNFSKGNSVGAPHIKVYPEGCHFKLQQNVFIASTKLKVEDIISISLLNKNYHTPFVLAVSHDTESIILTIRGTYSANDILTDLDSNMKYISDPEFYNCAAHSGMLNVAFNLNTLFQRDELIKNAMSTYQNYTLILTGHSLGGGVAVLLSCLLHKDYPNLKCYAFGPPFGTSNKRLSEFCKDFVLTVVNEFDWVSRASLPTISMFKKRLITALSRCTIPKYKLTLMHWVGCRCSDTYNTTYNVLNVFQRDLELWRGIECNNYLPGQIMNIIGIETLKHHMKQMVIRGTENGKCPSNYTIVITASEQFTTLVMHPNMITDHLPSRYVNRLYGIIKHNRISQPTIHHFLRHYWPEPVKDDQIKLPMLKCLGNESYLIDLKDSLVHSNINLTRFSSKFTHNKPLLDYSIPDEEEDETEDLY